MLSPTIFSPGILDALSKNRNIFAKYARPHLGMFKMVLFEMDLYLPPQYFTLSTMNAWLGTVRTTLRWLLYRYSYRPELLEYNAEEENPPPKANKRLGFRFKSLDISIERIDIGFVLFSDMERNKEDLFKRLIALSFLKPFKYGGNEQLFLLCLALGLTPQQAKEGYLDLPEDWLYTLLQEEKRDEIKWGKENLNAEKDG